MSRNLNRALLVLAAFLLASCDSSDSSAPAAPVAPELRISATPQMLHFDWDDAGDGTVYLIQVSEDGGLTFSAGTDGLKDLPFAAHLPESEDYLFRLEACRNSMCTPSQPVPVKPLVNDTVGVFNSENPETNNQFGHIMAISGDGHTLAISEYGSSSAVAGTADDCENESPTNCLPFSGSVSIYARSPAGWHLQTTLKASNAGAHDLFGEVVALSGNGNALIVGALGEDGMDTGVDSTPAADDCNGIGPTAPCVAESGAVYVFARTGTSWSQRAYIKAAHTRAGDGFGDEIALSRNGKTLVVGAMWEDGGGAGIDSNPLIDCDAPVPANCAVDSGAAYIFSQNVRGQWTQDAYLKAVGENMPAVRFANLLAISGNGRTVAVTRNVAAGDRAGVNLFTDFGAGWENDGDIVSTDSVLSDFYPALNYDGELLALGFPGASGVGSVILVPHTATTPAGDFVEVFAPAPITNTRFGSSVALSDDGTLMAVGAPLQSSGNTGFDGNHDVPCNEDNHLDCALASGAVYLFRYDGTTWPAIRSIKSKTNELFFDPVMPFREAPSSDFFGDRVALTADGYTLAVTAPWDDSGHAGVGGDTTDGCELLPVSNCVINSGSVLIY